MILVHAVLTVGWPANTYWELSLALLVFSNSLTEPARTSSLF